jgi:GTP cyclohydrolase II/3,4-dihydroxy 2-butanone 4-phosphate synthase/GTP cyclohydrolase II
VRRSKGAQPTSPEVARQSHVVAYAQAPLPTRRGPFTCHVFRDTRDHSEHVALVFGEVSGQEGVPVRVHSECLTSEVLGSLKCDCAEQLERGLDTIVAAERGVLLYLRQEGRGIGLGNKIRAYALQAQGADTFEANRALGLPDDLRRYDVAADMLRALNVRSVDLITNNPLKIAGLVDAGIPVQRRLPALAAATPQNVGYLRIKRDRTGHLLDALLDDDSDKKAG